MINPHSTALTTRLRANFFEADASAAADEIERLRSALRMFLDDPRFRVYVAGNPIAVKKMLAEARLTLDPAPPSGNESMGEK